MKGAYLVSTIMFAKWKDFNGLFPMGFAGTTGEEGATLTASATPVPPPPPPPLKAHVACQMILSLSMAARRSATGSSDAPTPSHLPTLPSSLRPVPPRLSHVSNVYISNQPTRQSQRQARFRSWMAPLRTRQVP